MCSIIFSPWGYPIIPNFWDNPKTPHISPGLCHQVTLGFCLPLFLCLLFSLAISGHPTTLHWFCWWEFVGWIKEHSPSNLIGSDIMYVYIYIVCIYIIHIYIYLFIYEHLCIYVFIYICVCVLLYIYVCALLYIYVYYIYMYIYILYYIYMYICIHIYIYLYIYVYIHIDIYEYINTWPHRPIEASSNTGHSSAKLPMPASCCLWQSGGTARPFETNQS